MNFYGITAVVDFLDVNLLLGSDWTASRTKRGNTILVVRLQTV